MGFQNYFPLIKTVSVEYFQNNNREYAFEIFFKVTVLRHMLLLQYCAKTP